METEIFITKLTATDDYVTYCLLLAQLTKIDVTNITKENFLNHLKLILSNPLHQIWIAKINDKIVGTATILIEPKIIHDLSYVGHIEDVVVDGSYRLKGIGKKLVDHLIVVAKNSGCYKIILDCDEKNMRFYQKSGFKQKENQMVIYL